MPKREAVRLLLIAGSRARPRNSICDLAQTARIWTHLVTYWVHIGYIFGIIRVYIGIYGYKVRPQKEDGKSAGIAREIGKVRPLLNA